MILISFQSGLPDQTSDVAIGSDTYTVRVKWNYRFSFWSMTIYDRDSEVVIAGVRMIRDSALLKGLHIPGIDGDFAFIRTYGDKEEADFDSLGADFSLYYVTRDEIDAELSSTS